MKALAVLALTTGAFLAAGDEKTDARKALGVWTVSAAVRDGKENKAIVGHIVTFTSEKFTIEQDGTILYEGTLKVGTGKPATIDFVHTGGEAKGKTWKGIWQRQGETLQICDNAPDTKAARPKSFAAKEGSPYALVTLKPRK